MKKNVFLLSLAALTGMTVFSSCLKSNSNNNTQPQAAVSVLQASPDAPPLDLLYNTTKVASAITYNQNGLTYPQPGNYDISIVNTNTGDKLAEISDSIQSAYYSLVIYDTAANRKIMLIQDQFEENQDPSKAFLRFLQLTPGLNPVDIYMDSVKLYSGRTFADNLQSSSLAQFKAISAGTHSFYALDANSDTLGTIKDVNLGAHAYTIYLSGLQGRTDSLGVTLRGIINFQ